MDKGGKKREMRNQRYVLCTAHMNNLMNNNAHPQIEMTVTCYLHWSKHRCWSVPKLNLFKTAVVRRCAPLPLIIHKLERSVIPVWEKYISEIRPEAYIELTSKYAEGYQGQIWCWALAFSHEVSSPVILCWYVVHQLHFPVINPYVLYSHEINILYSFAHVFLYSPCHHLA